MFRAMFSHPVNTTPVVDTDDDHVTRPCGGKWGTSARRGPQAPSVSFLLNGRVKIVPNSRI